MNDLDSSTTGYSTYASSTANAGVGWTPLGNSTTKFTGTFDGDSYSISDVYISVGTSVDYVGLFGYTTGSTIENLSVLDITIYGGDDYTGGLVGYNSSSSVTNCNISGNIYSCDDYVGGLVGYNSSSSVTNSYSTVNIDSSGSSNVGGLVGNNYSSSVTDSYSTGSVSGSTYVGGMIGLYSSGTIQDCFWDKTTSGLTTSGGAETGKTTTEMYTLSTFSSVWSIIGVASFDPLSPTTWYQNGGYDYPKLGWAYVGYEQLEGNVTFNSTAIEGATVYAVDTTNNRLYNKGDTDASGDYSIGVEKGTYHVACEYDSGTTKYNAESYPFVSVT